MSCPYQLKDKSMVLLVPGPRSGRKRHMNWSLHSFHLMGKLSQGEFTLDYVSDPRMSSDTHFPVVLCTKAASCQLSVSLHRIKCMLLRPTFRYDQTVAYKDPLSMEWKQKWCSLKWHRALLSWWLKCGCDDWSWSSHTGCCGERRIMQRVEKQDGESQVSHYYEPP